MKPSIASNRYVYLPWLWVPVGVFRLQTDSAPPVSATSASPDNLEATNFLFDINYGL